MLSARGNARNSVPQRDLISRIILNRVLLIGSSGTFKEFKALPSSFFLCIYSCISNTFTVGESDRLSSLCRALSSPPRKRRHRYPRQRLPCSKPPSGQAQGLQPGSGLERSSSPTTDIAHSQGSALIFSGWTVAHEDTCRHWGKRQPSVRA